MERLKKIELISALRGVRREVGQALGENHLPHAHKIDFPKSVGQLIKGLLVQEKKSQDAIKQGLIAVENTQKALSALNKSLQEPKPLDAYVCKLIVRSIPDNECCSISFMPFKTCKSIDVASCGHYFESLRDVPRWQDDTIDCPLCRKRITWTTVKIDVDIIDLT